MKKKSASIVLAIFLDILFGFYFMFFIYSIQKDKDELTYYMNQIGIYKELDNAEKVIEELNDINLDGYTYSNDDLLIVVTSISLNEEDVIEEQSILKKNKFNFILKEIKTYDEKVIHALKSNNFEEVMELMSK